MRPHGAHARHRAPAVKLGVVVPPRAPRQHELFFIAFVERAEDRAERRAVLRDAAAIDREAREQAHAARLRTGAN